MANNELEEQPNPQGHGAEVELQDALDALGDDTMSASQYAPNSLAAGFDLDSALDALDQWESPDITGQVKKLRKEFTKQQWTTRSDTIVNQYLKGLPKERTSWMPALAKAVLDGVPLQTPEDLKSYLGTDYPTLDMLIANEVVHLKRSKSKQEVPEEVITTWFNSVQTNMLARGQSVCLDHLVKELSLQGHPGIQPNQVMAKFLSLLYPKEAKQRDMKAIKFSYSGMACMKSIDKYLLEMASLFSKINELGGNPITELYPPSTLEQGESDLMAISSQLEVDGFLTDTSMLDGMSGRH